MNLTSLISFLICTGFALCTFLVSLKQIFCCGVKTEKDKQAYVVMKAEYKKLGSMTFAEGAVLTIFTVLVLLWFTREPGFIDGWATVLFNQEGA